MKELQVRTRNVVSVGLGKSQAKIRARPGLGLGLGLGFVGQVCAAFDFITGSNTSLRPSPKRKLLSWDIIVEVIG